MAQEPFVPCQLPGLRAAAASWEHLAEAAFDQDRVLWDCDWGHRADAGMARGWNANVAVAVTTMSLADEATIESVVLAPR